MRAPTILVLLCGLLALGACGGGRSEADTIKELLQEGGTTKNPSTCSGGSASLVAQNSFGSSAVAKDNERFCRENIAQLAPDSVDVEDVKVDGELATARFAVKGGGLPYDNATVRLRKAGGRWQIQRFTAVTLNRTHFERGTEKQLTTGADPLTRKQAGCMVRRLRRTGDREIERSIVTSEPTFILEPALRCGFGAALRSNGIPASEVDCMIDRLMRSPKGMARAMIAVGPAAEKQLNRRFDRAFAACD